MLHPDPAAPDYKEQMEKFKKDPGEWGPNRLLERDPPPVPQLQKDSGKK